MKISSGAINFSTIPNQVKKLITSIREHTKNGLASKITSVKNTHTSLNEKFKTGKDSPIEFALPQKIKDFFQPKDKNTLNKTLITVKNIKDTNNAGKKNISRVFCHPSCHWPGPSPASTRMELRDTALCPSVNRPVLVHAFLRSRPD